MRIILARLCRFYKGDRRLKEFLSSNNGLNELHWFLPPPIGGIREGLFLTSPLGGLRRDWGGFPYIYVSFALICGYHPYGLFGLFGFHCPQYTLAVAQFNIYELVGAYPRVRPPFYMIIVKYFNTYCPVLMRAHTGYAPTPSQTLLPPSGGLSRGFLRGD